MLVFLLACLLGLTTYVNVNWGALKYFTDVGHRTSTATCTSLQLGERGLLPDCMYKACMATLLLVDLCTMTKYETSGVLLDQACPTMIHKDYTICIVKFYYVFF